MTAVLVRVLLLVTLFASAAQAQGREFADTVWRLTEDGHLEMGLRWSHDGDRQEDPPGPVRAFGHLFGGPDSMIRQFGWHPYGLANLLLTAGRDGASRTNATLLFDKLGLGRGAHELNWRVGARPKDPDSWVRRRNVLHRLLAMRLVEQRTGSGMYSALWRTFTDPTAEPFTRRVARQVYQKVMRDERPPPADLVALDPPDPKTRMPAVLPRIPAGYDVAVRLRVASIPSIDPLLAARRRVADAMANEAMLKSGGIMSPMTFLGAQVSVDFPEVVPYEVAWRFGNWSADEIVGAIQFADVPCLWLHVGGVFDVAQAKVGLEREGVEVRGAAGSLRAKILDTSLALSRDALVVETGDFRAKGGADVASLRAAGIDGPAPVWIHARGPWKTLGPLGHFDAATLTMRFGDQTVAEMRVGFADGESAQRWVAAWASLPRRWRRALEKDPFVSDDVEKLDDLPHGVNATPKCELARIRWFEALHVECKGESVVVSVAAEWLEPERVAPVLFMFGAR